MRANGFNRKRVSYPGIAGDLQRSDLVPVRSVGKPLDAQGLSERDAEDGGDFWEGFLLTPVPHDLFVSLRAEDMELVLGRGRYYVGPTARKRNLTTLFRLALALPNADASERAQERQRQEAGRARAIILELADESRIKKMAQSIYDKVRRRTPPSPAERNAAIRYMHAHHPEKSQRDLARAFRVSVGTVNAALR